MSNAPYFKATEIAERAWQIQYEFCGGTPVYAYLVEGSDYALVIDTMNGYGNLRAFCETLTEKPMKLVNTHFHGDHTAGNFDFDACYMHHLDIQYFYGSHFGSPEQMLEDAKAEAKPEYRDLLEVSDFRGERDMRVYPLEHGDVFDLGDRRIEVVEVGGHTPGSIVLIDPKLRIAFTGDACNGNTLLAFGTALPVETYLKKLLRFKHYRPQFDIMYGGHQVLPPETIDEGIELCARIIAGTDDREEHESFGRTVLYGARLLRIDPIERVDGKSFNIAYDPEKILEDGETHRVISMSPASIF